MGAFTHSPDSEWGSPTTSPAPFPEVSPPARQAIFRLFPVHSYAILDSRERLSPAPCRADLFHKMVPATRQRPGTWPRRRHPP